MDVEGERSRERRVNELDVGRFHHWKEYRGRGIDGLTIWHWTECNSVRCARHAFRETKNRLLAYGPPFAQNGRLVLVVEHAQYYTWSRFLCFAIADLHFILHSPLSRSSSGSTNCLTDNRCTIIQCEALHKQRSKQSLSNEIFMQSQWRKIIKITCWDIWMLSFEVFKSMQNISQSITERRWIIRWRRSWRN